MIRKFTWLFCTLVATGLGAIADDVIVIDGQGRDGVTRFDATQYRVSGQQATVFLETLKRNLSISGYFREGSPSSSSLKLTGSASLKGNALSASVKLQSGGRQIFGKRYEIAAKQARTLGQQISDEILMAVKGKQGFASTRLVFVGKRAGVKGKEIYLVDPDGGDLVQLTRDGSIVLGPHWNPRGDGLVYTSYHRGFPDVYEVNLGSGRRNVRARYPGMNAGGSISPDGKSMALVLSREGKPELYVKNLSSGKLLRLTNTPMAPKSSPSWSPDGSQIVFVSGHGGNPHLYVVNKQGGQLRRLTRTGQENVSPDWGANGLIAFSRKIGRNYMVGVLDPRSGTTRMLSPADGDYEDPSWAPNGEHLVCSRTQRYQSSLVLLDTKGSSPVALLHGRGDWYMPDWSPK